MALLSVVAGLVALAFLLLTVAPKSGLYATFTVLSASMSPAIPEGSVVVVTAADPRTLKPGQVITFSASTPPYPILTHRIVAVEQTAKGPAFQTKGDANLLVDPWKVTYAGQAGLVRLSVPAIGYLIAAGASLPARTGLGLLLAGLLAFAWLSAVWARPRLAVAARQWQAASSAVAVRQPLAPARVAILAGLALTLLLLARVSIQRGRR